MIKQFTYKELTWIDLENPTEDELTELKQKYSIHPVALAELRQPSARSKVDSYKDFIYLILHFPFCRLCVAPGETVSSTPNQEVDFIVGKNFIITTHYESIAPLHDFTKLFDSDFALKHHRGKIHAGFILFYILREMYNSMESGLHLINNRLKLIEPKVFSGQEREVVTDLAGISRDLLDCRWNLRSHRELLESLEHAGADLFGAKFRFYLRALRGEYDKIWDMVESNRHTFLELRETNESLLAIKSNETMKLLTVIAFIFFPVAVIPQIFGMNTTLPLIGQPHDFYLVLALMLASSIVMYVLARYKKWF